MLIFAPVLINKIFEYINDIIKVQIYQHAYLEYKCVCIVLYVLIYIAL